MVKSPTMPDDTSDPTVSVILPVRNGESQLEACLDALLAQTYDSMEVIAIDDGSTDATPAILDKRMVEDSRLHVIHQTQAGVWAARLTGISMAKGKWLSACDADDIPHPELISKLLNSAESNNAQMAVCSYQRLDAHTGALVAVESVPRTATLKPDKDPVGFACINAALWNKLVHMDVVRSSLVVKGAAHQDKPRLMEDMVLLASFVTHVETVSFVHEPLYDYFVSPTSSMRTLTVEDAQTVARWLKIVRSGTEDRLKACLDVMAFLHLGVAALDNMARTTSRRQIHSYLRWVRGVMRRDFPRYTAPATSTDGYIKKLRIARRLFQVDLLLPAIRVLGVVNRLTHREVT